MEFYCRRRTETWEECTHLTALLRECLQVVCIVTPRQPNHPFASVCCLGPVVKSVVLNHWFSFMLSIVVCLAVSRTTCPVIDPAVGSHFLLAIEKRH